MLIALMTILLLGGGATGAGSEFAGRLDKAVGKGLKDKAARTEARSAVGEMKAAFEQYDAEVKRTLEEAAKTNSGYTVSAVDFENLFQVLDRARAETMGRLVAARAKLRQAIPADQWDAVVGAAVNPKR